MDSGTFNYRRFRDGGDENGLVEIIKEYKDGLIFYLNSIGRQYSYRRRAGGGYLCAARHQKAAR